jgi:hypothetical protein
MDQYVFNDGNTDRDWDAVWEAETYSDDKGWYAELRIPFSAIRYRPSDEMTWGLQVYRWMHGRGEDIGWAHWDRNTSGFVSRFGTLTGLRDINAPRQFEVTPYVVSRATDPSADGVADEIDEFGNFGADLKYGVTADLTLNATFQPDFGQVEADPATLNLSPFETFFEEKRPFFIEGARFFEHPSFNLVYTRRIGTGSENSRIRYAGKVTGKLAGNITSAAMFAATDVTGNGQAHNFLKGGIDKNYFAVARLGRDFNEGKHSINVMQTGVWRTGRDQLEGTSSRASRDGFSSGGDFEMNFRDRTYNVSGGAVYTMVDNAPLVDDSGTKIIGSNHAPKHGTGGRLSLAKYGGQYRGQINGSWEHDKLDPNDFGILFAPDEISSNGWFQRRYNSDGDEDAYINQGNVNLNFHRSWLYGAREFDVSRIGDPRTASYNRGKPLNAGMNINGWTENKHRWSVNYGVWHDFEGRNKFATRGVDGVRGPIMKRPGETGFWVGMNSDWRKPFKLDMNFESGLEHDENKIFSGFDADQGYFFNWNAGVNWVQSSRLNHRISFFFRRTREDDQWLGNFENIGGGIGDVSYVFGRLDQKVFDVTLRSNVLFSRDKSLEFYVQPFITVGDYHNARELLRPDSYDFQPYAVDGFEARNSDFEFASVNLNAVYRWEYRPGSTVFLVWSHARNRFGEREQGEQFTNDFDPSTLFSTEPENTIQLKLSYWLSI